MPKRTVVCDIETDGLLSNATQIWCIVCKDWDSGEIFSWIPEDIMDFPAWAEDNVHHWIGHNFVGYDLRVLKKIMGLRIRPSRVTDTLLLSRLYDITLKGGHSLENWGKILNYPKLPFKDFSEYNEKMLEYCINDVELTYKVAVALKFGGEANDIEAVTIEHRSQYIVDSQCEFGFALDVPKAHKLLAHLKSKATQLEETILAVAPPLPVPLQVIEPRYTKDGNLSKVNLKFMGTTDYTNVAGPFTRLKWEEFNLNSPKQKVKRLSPYWSPVIRTKGYRKLLDKQRDKTITQEEFNDKARYTWQLCEENLETINDDAPEELKLLGKYAVVSARAKEVEGWFDALGTDDRVHGTVFSIGAVTHRMSHNSPNMANIPAIGSAYGEVCRSCFTIGDPETHTLLGCDASGIQLRILAHYMDDDDYSHEVVNGDIHTKNLEAMGIDKGEWNDDKGQWTARDTAKTFIYAWLLGAGDEKVGLITGGTPADGRRVKETFLSSLPALARLKQNAASSARLGRLVGLDGRYIPIKSEHFALSCYLQGGESCVMKYAMLLWHEWIRKRKLDARQVAVVHDEFQIEVRKEHADEVGELVKQSIITAGQHFKLNVPMDAEYRTGENWAHTH